MAELHVGDTLHGFTVVSIQKLDEYNGKGIRLRHDATGLDLYHLRNEDRENLFAFAFKTPPRDNTGVAHIVEHAVLSGSSSFPIKDPFLALMKGSTNTFMNAMTYPDKTVYPAATTVRSDYYNMMKVYGDAVFFPLLRKEVFHQEGRRIELDEKGRPQVQGIVYNEMKGSYSSFESIVGEWSYRSVFTDSPYYYDSGGYPAEIPGLDYEGFRRYHSTYYHPSNCRVFLYGNLPTEEQLEFLQREFLSGFRAGAAAEEIPAQPRWKEPREMEVKGPLSDDEGEEEAKTTVILNWLVGSSTEPLEMLSIQVLSDMLLGYSGTPLQKAINESGLGEDMAPASGLETDVAEIVFTAGLRGTDRGKKKAFEQLVMNELERLAREGLPRDLVEGSLRRVEFRNREIKGGAPFGLRLMGRALRGWLHGKAPEATLEFTPHIEELKRRYEQQERYFERLIEELLLNNPHRSTVTVVPDRRYLRELDEEISERVAQKTAAMGEEEQRQLEEELNAFRTFQETPDREEDRQKIPRVSREELPEDIPVIDTREEQIGGIPCYSHDLYTNGIIYVDWAFDIGELTREQRLLLPLLGRMIVSSGLPGESYDRVARRMALSTGGIHPYLEESPLVGQRDRYLGLMLFRLKCLEGSLDEALDLLTELLLRAEVDDVKRLREVLLEFRNDMRSAVIPAGHSFASLRARSRLSRSSAVEEEWRGIEQLLFLSGFDPEAEHGLDDLARRLAELRESLIRRGGMLINVTAEGEWIGTVKERIGTMVQRLPGGSAANRSAPGDTDAERHIAQSNAVYTDLEAETCDWEGLEIPAAVGYAATALPGAYFGEPGHALQVLIAHILKTDYLWERIRMNGGAYGAGASAHGLEGLFSFFSYRDPSAGNSLQVFLRGIEQIASGNFSKADLEQAVVSVVGHDLRPHSPGEKSLIGLRRRLLGITDEIRREKRRHLLTASQEGLEEEAAAMSRLVDGAARVVLASRNVLEEAESRYPEARVRRTRVPL
jgi:Zn-dependent M16 (insulinase) family peptidase